MSALFGSLQHVGGLLATMWSSFQLSLERLPLHRALAQSQCLTIKRMHLDEPFICDWLEGKRWLVCIKGKSVSIVGAFWSEQQKINNCQIVFLVSLKWFKRWIKRIWVTYILTSSQRQKLHGENIFEGTYLIFCLFTSQWLSLWLSLN